MATFGAGRVLSGEEQEAAPQEPPAAPRPPAEIKALDAFIGPWRSTYEFMPAMMGQAGTGTGTGTGSYNWMLNGWFVMSKFQGTSTMGDYEMIGMMTFDPSSKAYRAFHFSDHGECDEATMTYEPEARTWTMTSEGRDFETGKPMKNRTVMRFVTPDRLEWERSGQREGETEFTAFMKGTDTRMSPLRGR